MFKDEKPEYYCDNKMIIFKIEMEYFVIKSFSQLFPYAGQS